MDRVLAILGGLAGALGVMTGAFGAHALRTRLTPEMRAVYETGVQYHLIHAVAILAAAWAAARWPGSSASIAGWCFLVGIALFSGSLYGLSLSGLRLLGAITPLGGAAFIAGWLLLAWAARQGQ
jgi:uncharacterized membrane protein YgdD (TMEM256/DUF423 family)